MITSSREQKHTRSRERREGAAATAQDTPAIRAIKDERETYPASLRTRIRCIKNATEHFVHVTCINHHSSVKSHCIRCTTPPSMHKADAEFVKSFELRNDTNVHTTMSFQTKLTMGVIRNHKYRLHTSVQLSTNFLFKFVRQASIQCSRL